MSVTRGDFLKQLGKSLPGMVLGSGTALAAQKIFGKIAATAAGSAKNPTAAAKPFTLKTGTIDFIKHGPVHGNRVALTFDDGPVPGVTDRILDELKKRHLHATFFMIGERVDTAPELARRVLAEGHDVGNHTYTHPNLTTLPDAQMEAEIQKTQELMRNVMDHQPVFFRPPFGALRQNQAGLLAAKGLRIVCWGVDSQDWSKPSVAKIAENILPQTQAGSIILCHDMHVQTAEAIGSILDGLQERGFAPTKLSHFLE